jgi:hypothetical protein
MKDQFVPYEIAVKLKEKGFDEPCLGFYYDEGKFSFWNWTVFNEYPHLTKNTAMIMTDYISAPLWQQVIDWFREKHNLIMWVEARYGFKKKYFWFIHFDVLIKDDIFDLHIETYEEARQEAIEHALTLI